MNERPRVDLSPKQGSPPPVEPPKDAGPITNGGTAPPETEVVKTQWPIRIQLKKPIRDKHGNPTDTIEFREPTAGDLMAVGDPYYLSLETGQLLFDPSKFLPFMARLSLTPMAFLEQMDISDYQLCKLALGRFFYPDLTRLQSSSTATD